MESYDDNEILLEGERRTEKEDEKQINVIHNIISPLTVRVPQNYILPLHQKLRRSPDTFYMKQKMKNC